MKPTLLVIGPTYTIAVNRQKLWALTTYFDVTCATSRSCDRVIFGHPIFESEEGETSEPITVLRFREFPRKQRDTRMVYAGLDRALKSRSFDLVLVESEPWALVKWQAWLLTRCFQRGARFGEFSWENVERTGWKGKLLAWIYRLSSRLDDFVICGNKNCREIFLRQGARPDRALVAAQLGVDPEQFSPVEPAELKELRLRRGLPPDSYLVGFCGRFEPEKGVLDLVAAIQSLRGAFPQLELVLQGTGSLLPQLRGHNLPWMHILEAVPHFEVPDFLRSIDVLVLPSKPFKSRQRVWEEQFGHVLIEAMACGTLVLGSDSGSIPEVIGDPEAIFQNSNIDDLAQHLRAVFVDTALQRRLRERQRQRVFDYFTNERVAARYAGFLLRLVNARQTEGGGDQASREDCEPPET